MSATPTPQEGEKSSMFTVVLRHPEYLARNESKYGVHQVRTADAEAALSQAQRQACDMSDAETPDDFEHVLTIPGWVEPSHMGPEREALRWQSV